MQIKLTNNPGLDPTELRRKSRRHHAKEGAFAGFLALDDGRIVNLGEIIDISVHGLGFRYTPIAAQPNDFFTHIRLFTRSDSLVFIDKIPCRVIYDQALSVSSWSYLTERRCGVEFMELDPGMEHQVTEFIKQVSSASNRHGSSDELALSCSLPH